MSAIVRVPPNGLASSSNESAQVSNGLSLAETYSHYGFSINTWAMFERSVDIAVWIAFRIDLDLAPAITDQVQSIRSKLIMIESVVEKKGATKTDLRKLKQFRNSIEGITRERNRLVHDPHITNKKGVLLAIRGIPEKETDPDAQFKNTLRSEVMYVTMLLDFIERTNRFHDEYVALYSEIFVRVGLGPSDETLLPKPPPT